MKELIYKVTLFAGILLEFHGAYKLQTDSAVDVIKNNPFVVYSEEMQKHPKLKGFYANYRNLLTLFITILGLSRLFLLKKALSKKKKDESKDLNYFVLTIHIIETIFFYKEAKNQIDLNIPLTNEGKGLLAILFVNPIVMIQNL